MAAINSVSSTDLSTVREQRMFGWAILRRPLCQAIILLVASTSLLAWFMQPRPKETHHLVQDDDILINSSDIILSPDGKYLAIRSYPEGIKVIEAFTKRIIFNSKCNDFKNCRFNTSSELVYCYSHADERRKFVSQLALFVWRPSDSSPTLLGSWNSFRLSAIDMLEEASPKFSGLSGLGRHEYPENCLLSSDTRWWLVPELKGNTVTLQVIDSRTGTNQSGFVPPVVDLRTPVAQSWRAAFCSDSQSLILKTNDTLEWYGLPSGRKVRSSIIPGTHEIDKLCRADSESMAALHFPLRATGDDTICLQLMKADNTWETIPLTETVPQPRAIPFNGSMCNLLLEFSSHVDQASNTLIYFWRHVVATEAFILGAPPSLPGYYYSVRDLSTGRLVHSGKIASCDEKVESYYPVKTTVLPGPIIAMEMQCAASPVVDILESWRYKYFSWMPSLLQHTGRTLRFIECSSGHLVEELSLPVRNMIYGLSNDLRTIVILGNTTIGSTDEIVYSYYDYPFRKPWLLILGWSALVTLIVTLLAKAVQFLKVGRRCVP
ncbi:MAG: hypothetical protein QM775_28330 [Pirellulales bacterium]